MTHDYQSLEPNTAIMERNTTPLDHDDDIETSSETHAPLSSAQNQIADELFRSARNLITELQEVLQQETQALKDANIREALTLQDKKIKLVQRYQELAERAKQQQAVLKASQSPIKEEIRTLEKDFKTCTKDNLNALSNGKSSLERLVNRMLESIRKTVKQDKFAYNASGGLDNRQQQSLSINLDKTL